jgi:hypothetical protein
MGVSENMNIIRENKNILFIALAVGALLLVPLIAMQVTDEVAWSKVDFATAGALLFGTGLAYELISRKANNLAYRLALNIALAGALLLVWINLAVGIIGSEDNPANLMYIGVLAVVIIGALIARFRPLGLAFALFATALAQALVTVIALIVERDLPVLQTVVINGFFIMLWIASALLFRRANTH